VIVLTGLALVAAVVWICLALGHAWFWRTDIRLPEADVPAGWPAVSVVVPARDDAALLPITLPTLLAQDYPGPFNVLLVDDRSTDGTAAVGRRLAATATRALTVVTGSEPPPGWTGKLWAPQQGLDRLPEPAPEFVLFTDADIAHPPNSLRRLVGAALAGQRDLVSLMALLPAQRRWERLLIPAFVYFGRCARRNTNGEAR
jgi:glycosyltransferase involved in cell wall biosynthesis